jgi:hypothetical protein
MAGNAPTTALGSALPRWRPSRFQVPGPSWHGFLFCIKRE